MSYLNIIEKVLGLIFVSNALLFTFCIYNEQYRVFCSNAVVFISSALLNNIFCLHRSVKSQLKLSLFLKVI